MYTFALDCYERAVRTEDIRKDVDILRCYISLGLEVARKQDNMKQSKYVYWRIVNTLEETICDSLLSFFWRKKVYASIKQFKPIMYEILTEKEYDSFIYRLKLHAEYFLEGAQLPESSADENTNSFANNQTPVTKNSTNR
ncbi:MAG: hypothetical protein AAGJ37_01895 [Pseudomonadota bacterium]